MAKRLDLERVRSALKKAAKSATSGSTEFRSGRFMARDSMSGQFAQKTSVFRPNSDSKTNVAGGDASEGAKKR
jgi:hypothetical protein